MLGSAIAFRLFLFFVPFVVAAVGLVDVFGTNAVVRDALRWARVDGSLATEIEDAVTRSQRHGVGLLVTGAVLTVWAGRTLTKVLAATAAAAWQEDPRAARPTVRGVLTVSGLVASLSITNTVLTRVQEQRGAAVTIGALAGATAVYGVTWFAVTAVLPRSTSDPGALLPGAALFGASTAGLSWFMHFYLPGHIARASATMGSLAFTIATLGYLFLVGRVASATFVLDAVVWERHGSVSSRAFGLPGLRSLARRSVAVRRYFDLEATEAEAEAVDEDEDGRGAVRS